MPIYPHIAERIEKKKLDYPSYNFTLAESHALMTFFDLAQEFRSIDDFYNLSVAVPRMFFGLDVRLFLIEQRSGNLTLAATTEERRDISRHPLAGALKPSDEVYVTDEGRLVATIRGRKMNMEELPFTTEDDVLGVLEVFPVQDRDEHVKLFFGKYANRIGFRLHNKFLVEKNLEHLRFIRSLVADIEHNVIVPNMVYKLFLRNLKGKARKNRELERLLLEKTLKERNEDGSMEHILEEIADVNSGLSRELENIEKHYKNMSLFIETLFRKSHFDQGRLVLRTKQCNMKRDVVIPQLERYLYQFQKAGVSIDDRLSGIPDEDVIDVVDVGLIAQVYANLFSNALKYTQEVEIFGEMKKYIAYGYQIVKDFFGPGRDGSKYNVFTTGPHIPLEERSRIFDEEYRGVNAGNVPGTGHGLAFVRNVIEIHGGVAGYEPTDYGNNFYFILPVRKG